MDDKQRRALGRAAGAARPIGAYAAGALDAFARARGFATTSLLSEWGTIVGAELAQFTMPDRVIWPKRRDEAQVADAPKGHRVEGATLVLRVEGPRAIEVQHRSGQILERVNAYFGYRAIAEMRILQAPVAPQTRAGPPQSRRSIPTCCPPPLPSRMAACARPCCGSAPTPAPSSQAVERSYLALARTRVFNECRPGSKRSQQVE